MPISLSEIVDTYAKRTAWSPACCGVTLSDGTRVFPTKAGDGIQVYRPGARPRYVAFTDAPSIDWSKRYPI